MKEHCEQYGPSILRLALGPLFIIPGVMKLMNPGMIIGMLGQIGFPAPTFFGWLLLLSEIIFGASVLVGYKVKLTVWPLVIVLAVATITVHIPSIATNPMGLIDVLFRLLGIAALISLHFTGPGAVAVQED
ncbi:DoxX family protein [Candidatus Woesearchaeota archaeon]|nr:DoxX family protein [Candidatus Woesearchaeota archaeon]